MFGVRGEDAVLSRQVAAWSRHQRRQPGQKLNRLGNVAPSFYCMANSYCAQRSNKDALLVHYSDLTVDRVREMRRVANFLEIDTPERRWPELAAAASFEAMKQQGDGLAADVAPGEWLALCRRVRVAYYGR